MTPAQTDFVKRSFEYIQPIAGKAGALFYGRLFEIDPELRKLFKGDLGEQGEKLMAMIGIAVHGLDRLDTVVPAVEALGVRHGRYGVRDKDYDTVCEALLWTLERGLGTFFTADVKEAWIAAYTLLATTMKNAARRSTSAAGA